MAGPPRQYRPGASVKRLPGSNLSAAVRTGRPADARRSSVGHNRTLYDREAHDGSVRGHAREACRAAVRGAEVERAIMAAHEERDAPRSEQPALGARGARTRAEEVARARRPVHDDLRPSDRAPLHAPTTSPASTTRATSTIPARSPTRAASIRPAIAASSGRCGSSPGSARRRRPTSATRRCSQAGGTGLSVAFDLPTLMGRDPDHELSLGEVGKCGVSIVSLADMERLFDGIRARRHHDVDDDQLAGADDLRDVPGRRREAGRGLEDAVGHDPERHPQGVHRAEGVHLPAAPVDAAHHRHLRVLRAAKCRAGTRSR